MHGGCVIVSVDVLVGIPSRDEAETIGGVVTRADQGLSAISGQLSAVIVNVDNGTGGDTREAFMATPARYPKRFSRPDQAAGKGGNVWTILRMAAEHEARAVVLLDADVRSATAEWVAKLAGPVLADTADFVTPRYATSQGGPLRTLICRPVVDGLFRAEVEQPTGGEFGFSGALASAFLRHTPSPAVLRYGVDIHLTTEAVQRRARLACADLGAKAHRLRPWHTITPIVADVVEAALQQLHRYRGQLDLDQPLSDRLGTFAPAARRVVPGEELRALAEHYRAGMRAHEPLYRRILPDELFRELDGAEVTAGQWPRILGAFIEYALDRPAAHAVSAAALMPLFEGRMVSYATELRDAKGLACLNVIGSTS